MDPKVVSLKETVLKICRLLDRYSDEEIGEMLKMLDALYMRIRLASKNES